MVAVGQEPARFGELPEHCVRAVAFHEPLVAYGRKVQGNLTVAGEPLDVARHGVADVDALGAGRDHEAPGIAVVHQKVHVVRRDFVGGQLWNGQA